MASRYSGEDDPGAINPGETWRIKPGLKKRQGGHPTELQVMHVGGGHIQARTLKPSREYNKHDRYRRQAFIHRFYKVD